MPFVLWIELSGSYSQLEWSHDIRTVYDKYAICGVMITTNWATKSPFGSREPFQLCLEMHAIMKMADLMKGNFLKWN